MAPEAGGVTVLLVARQIDAAPTGGVKVLLVAHQIECNHARLHSLVHMRSGTVQGKRHADLM